MIFSNAFRESNLAPDKFIAGVIEGEYSSRAGQAVNGETARNVATAYRCINILSDDIAKLPFQMFTSRVRGTIERVKPVAIPYQNIPYLWEISSNRWMIPFVLKKMAVMWLLTHGAAFIWNPPRVGGRRREMFVLPSDRTYPFFDNAGNLWYHTIFSSGEEEDIPSVEVLSWLINSIDGISGRGIIHYARETIGRQLGGYETQSRFYGQGLNPGGIVYMAGELSKDARQKVRESYGEAMSGSENAYRLAVFDAKVTKFEAITMKPVDAQFLESLQENDAQIANFFGMPLYKLNQGKQSYQSNEQQNLDYLNTTLDPYLVQMEQSTALKMLPEEEQGSTYFRVNRDALLRTDAKTRGEYLAKKIETGQLSPNEAREIEDQSFYPLGNAYYVPSNWQKVQP